jgi:hypothetical protein
MIVDQEYASNVVSQISQLVDEFNKQSPIHVALCADVVRPSVKLDRQSDMDCAVEEFDSYMVVTNGDWGYASWAGVLVAMPTWASDRLQVLMKRVEADAARGTCELVLRPRNDGSYEIGGAVSVIDFSNKKGVGACFVSVFLGSMGVSPFEGKDRLDVRAEAASYAEFLLKQKPSGGLYLTKMLYSPALSAGMGEAQAKQVLEKLILDTE